MSSTNLVSPLIVVFVGNNALVKLQLLLSIFYPYPYSSIAIASKNFLKCIPCIAAAYKLFPLRHLLYIFLFKNLFMEGTATISLSESPYGPPDPSVILPRDEKNDISA